MLVLLLLLLNLHLLFCMSLSLRLLLIVKELTCEDFFMGVEELFEYCVLCLAQLLQYNLKGRIHVFVPK